MESVSNSFAECEFWSLTYSVLLEERIARLWARLVELLTEHDKTTYGCALDEASRGIYEYLLVKFSPIEMTRIPLSNLITEIELEITGCLGNESTHTEALFLENNDS
jgi:hypothetical protein